MWSVTMRLVTMAVLLDIAFPECDADQRISPGHLREVRRTSRAAHLAGALLSRVRRVRLSRFRDSVTKIHDQPGDLIRVVQLWAMSGSGKDYQFTPRNLLLQSPARMYWDDAITSAMYNQCRATDLYAAVATQGFMRVAACVASQPSHCRRPEISSHQYATTSGSAATPGL